MDIHPFTCGASTVGKKSIALPMMLSHCLTQNLTRGFAQLAVVRISCRDWQPARTGSTPTLPQKWMQFAEGHVLCRDASGLTDHLWSICELLSDKVAPALWVEPKRRGRPVPERCLIPTCRSVHQDDPVKSL